MKEDDPGSGTQERDGNRRDVEVQLRRVAHDINGALNTLVLNIELLGRAMEADEADPDTGRDASERAARELRLATLRRAAGEIQHIVRERLVPLAGGDSGSGRGAR